LSLFQKLELNPSSLYILADVTVLRGLVFRRFGESGCIHLQGELTHHNMVSSPNKLTNHREGLMTLLVSVASTPFVGLFYHLR